MSGSDGPSTGGAIWPGGGEDDSCARLKIDAWVSAQDPDYEFRLDEIFDLSLDDRNAPTVELVTASGQTVGAVNPLPALVRCLRNGATFAATVTHVDNAAVKVRIEEAS